MAIKIGNKIVQADGGGYQPQGVRDTPSQQQQNVYKQAFDTMKKAGITGVGDTNKDRRDLAEQMYKSAVIQNDPSANTDYNVITESSPPSKKEKDKVPLIDQFDQFMTSFGKNKINIPFPSIATFGASALEGMNANSALFKKLLEGSELDSSDKVALVTLTKNTYPRDVINEYAKKNELSNDELYNIYKNYNEEYGKIDERVDDEEDNISDYIDRMNNMSFGETVGTMYGDLTGKRDTSGITTLENITDNLGSEGLAYLKLTDPKTYYRLRPAQTSDQMRDLANVAMPTGNSPEDRRFAAQIMEAREMAARSKESQDRASGIMTASSAPPVPPPVVPPEMKEDPVPENPILNPVMSQRDPFNLAQFYASLPQYTQQGVMSPSLMQYYRNLGLFPRS